MQINVSPAPVQTCLEAPIPTLEEDWVPQSIHKKTSGPQSGQESEWGAG